jgi:hypothetical protein
MVNAAPVNAPDVEMYGGIKSSDVIPLASVTRATLSSQNYCPEFKFFVTAGEV